ncbi:hypothetical protein PMAYCL1PPCAC_03971, partial [Pristionchus mayeri]
HHEQRFMIETEKELFEQYRMGCAAFTPVEDGFMGERAQIPHRTGKQGAIASAARVPALLSTTSDERVVATRDLVRTQFEQAGSSILHFLPTIMHQEQSSLAEVVSAISSHYFDGNTKMDSKMFEKLLTTSQNGEQFAATHAEALDYAAANKSVHILKNDVHDANFPSWHGVDIWLLFDCFDLADRSGFGNWSYAEWRGFDRFRNRLADTVAEFVRTGTLKNASPFTRYTRVATKISQEGSVTVDADTEHYYFWKQTIPAIEALHDSPSTRTAGKTPLCAQHYEIPFYVATTFLLAAMLACGFLFSQRRRRPTRERKALRHAPLG